MCGDINRRVGRVVSVVAAALGCCLLCSCGILGGGGPVVWTARSQWEVTCDERGAYRAYHVREARSDRLIVTVSTTDKTHGWQKWLMGGSEGAQSRLTYVVALPGWKVLSRYDHAAQEGEAPAAAEDTFRKQGRTVAHGLGVYAPGRRIINEFSERPSIWTGFYSDPAKVSTHACPATKGLSPYAVGAGSLVELAGMEVGDIVVKLWPWDYDDDIFESYITIGHAVKDRFAVGDPARVEFLRAKPEGGYTVFHKELTWPGVPGMDRRPGAKLLAFEKQWLPRAETPEKKLMDTMAAQTGRAADNADLMHRLAGRHVLCDAYRLPAMLAVHKNPFLMEPIARDLVAGVPAPGADRIAKQVAWLRGVFLTEAPAAPDLKVRDWKGTDIKGHLDYMEDVLALAAHYHELAFKDLSAEDRKLIEDAAPGLLEGFVAAHMMCFDPEVERQRANIRLFAAAERLNTAALIAQAETVARLTDGEFLASLKALMEASERSGGHIASRNSKAGRIVLNGTADDRYMAGTEAAVIVDLGGDEVYANNAGSSVPGKIPSAVLVDFAGNDRYENWKLMRQGCGFMGVGMLVDCAGDDSYVGVRYCQGAGFMGIGVLADLAGDDVYRAIDYAHGVGQFGAGLLLDDKGKNRYEGHQACQGVGFTWGVGLLYSADPAGEDLYYCKGQHGSAYGDAGSFEGWGQGIGTGHRPYASGGIGILLDGGGGDLYEAGTFSTGGGYFFGLGILNDRAGDDRYRGSRYNMGFTAHQAVGIFLDDAGDDRYHTSHFVAMGMAWDESCTLFIDRAGDDVYVAPGFALGASAMNGFTLFVDADGSDRYQGVPPAAVHGNSYHGGTSIGYFLDLGAGTDEFSKREAGQIAVGGEHWFFADAPTVQEAQKRIEAQPLKRE